ncbi:MAG: alpha/beta fold hydrolase [Kiritimatiellia bacterium]
MDGKKLVLTAGLAALAAMNAGAARQGPWAKEKAWQWYDAQPWIRGCNYMPASAANRVDQWQELGAEERFAEVERELALAEKIGFNTLRIIVEHQGFGVWLAEHDGFMARFERMLSIMQKHGLRAIVVLGNDCSRPKELWELPKPGVQKYDLGYHGGRRVTQHGSNPHAVGYTTVDDPVLRPKFYAMCAELLTKYRDDERILFWNLWNEPGNNNRSQLTMKDMRELFELAWSIDPKQPLAADIWTARASNKGEGTRPAEKLAGELSDIISFHLYANYQEQKSTIAALRVRWGRPMINTEWLARIAGDELRTSYPVFAQERVGAVNWGFVAGKYQTYEPYEPQWKSQFEFWNSDAPVTRWYHDLFRPSHHPYDPEEIAIVRRVNAQMDAERQGNSTRARIARAHKIIGEDMWQGYRRTRFQFMGREAWVVEPSVAPRDGMPWTWTMQWADAFVDRTGVPELLRKGFHHAMIQLFDTRMNEEGLKIAAAFQQLLVDELGFAPKANLIGLGWGGFFATRYAAAHPSDVAKMYLDAPLLTFDRFARDLGPWTCRKPASGSWSDCAEMPVNLAAKIAEAKIPVLLLYGGEDQTVPPQCNSEPFIQRFKAAGGTITVNARPRYGHAPHGLDPDKQTPLRDFFMSR